MKPGHVVIFGADIAGASASQVAAGIGVYVGILDVNPARLRYVHDILGGHVTTVMSNRVNIEGGVTTADQGVNSVLVPGSRAGKGGGSGAYIVSGQTHAVNLSQRNAELRSAKPPYKESQRPFQGVVSASRQARSLRER